MGRLGTTHDCKPGIGQETPPLPQTGRRGRGPIYYPAKQIEERHAVTPCKATRYTLPHYQEPLDWVGVPFGPRVHAPQPRPTSDSFGKPVMAAFLAPESPARSLWPNPPAGCRNGLAGATMSTAPSVPSGLACARVWGIAITLVGYPLECGNLFPLSGRPSILSQAATQKRGVESGNRKAKSGNKFPHSKGRSHRCSSASAGSLGSSAPPHCKRLAFRCKSFRCNIRQFRRIAADRFDIPPAR